MALRVTDAGAIYFGKVMMGLEVPSELFVELFVDVGPGGEPPTLLDSDGDGAARELASGGGYVEKDLGPTPTVTSVDGIPVIQWPQLEWVFTGPLTNVSGNTEVQGYAVFTLTNILLFEELLDTPFTPQVSGDTVRVNVKLQLGNGTPA